MNHLETYAMAKAANVQSAKELLKLATCRHLKVINYISTLGVFSPLATAPGRVASEHSPIDHERHLSSRGYVASKWVGEKIFLTANARGIPCNVFRLGLAWADAEQGRFDELQNLYRLLATCLLSGYGIENYRYHMGPVPVDHIARAIVALADRHCDGGGILHISGREPAIDGIFERCNELTDVPLILLPFYEWIQEIKRLHRQGRSLPAVPLMEFAFSMDASTFREHQRQTEAARIRFDCARTDGQLSQVGIVMPVLGDELLRRCLLTMLARDTRLQELNRSRRRIALS